MNLWRVVVCLVAAWVLILVYLSTMVMQPSDTGDKMERQLTKAMEEILLLKKQNLELQRLTNELRDVRLVVGVGGENSAAVKLLQNKLNEANREIRQLNLQMGDKAPLNQAEGDAVAGSKILSDGPSAEHEKLRRKLYNGVTELWYFIRSELKKIKNVAKDNRQLNTKVNDLLDDAGHQERSILTDLHSLSQIDGAEDWRKKEAKDLEALVQRRFHYLQNPKDCQNAKKLICNVNKGCGFGCQIHHVAYCFILAYATERTMILQSSGWRYSSGGWEKVFMPVSDSCRNAAAKSSRGWGPENEIKDVQAVSLPIVDSIRPRPDQLPQSIPEDLAPRLTRFHGHPFVWWMGQVVKYLLRYQPELKQDLDNVQAKFGFKNPIVGIHVRRTDKVGTEAAFHSIEEYMFHVDEYYELLSRRQKIEKKRVYLASDDPGVLPEARSKFPNYEFVGDQDIAKSAGLGSRYSDMSLRGIIIDIHFLSMTDFLVCTFSSQVCRLAYEIMQTMHTDASTYFRSLDDVYYYGGQHGHNQIAIYAHSPRPGEIPLEPGDLVGIAGNHWDGYSKGENKRVSKTGLYPSYKVKEKIEIAKFPTYPEADKNT